MADFKYNLALVLGGGGARGIAHIGVIRVLQREGIKIDLIVGTSMGSIVGGMYAQNPSIDLVENKLISKIESYSVKAKWVKFLSESNLRDSHSFVRDISYHIKWHLAGIRSLNVIALEVKEVLYAPLKEIFGDYKIENCKIPYAAVAMDLRSGMQMVLTRGPLVDAVYSSSAIQGVLPPLEYKRHLLCDGGQVAIVPVQIAREMGARYVVAVDVWGDIRPEKEFASGLEVIFRADSVGLDRLRRTDLALADVIISPDVEKVHWGNFARAKDCIMQGEKAAEMAIHRTKELIATKPWWKKLIGKA